jgi:GDP-D-mannose dehydratase
MKALSTGITSRTVLALAGFLLARGYEVLVIVSRVANVDIDYTPFVVSAVKRYARGFGFLFAGSSGTLGVMEETPRNERMRFRPRYSYGIGEAAGYELKRNYRVACNLQATGSVHGVTFALPAMESV